MTEPQAFRELFARHFDPLFTYFARRLGRDAADDLTAEVFLTAFDRRARYDLARADARAVALRHRRQPAAPPPARRGAAPPCPGARGRTVRGRRRRRRLERLDARAAGPAMAGALASLPARQREVLLLFAWAELGYEEIARALDVPVGTVRSRLSRARARVRRELDGPHALIAETRTGPCPSGRGVP